jgi:YfiH family protein
LVEGRFASIDLFTDPALFAATGTRIAFTTRHGGVSEGPYASLNLGHHVDDDLDAVLRNRQILLDAVGCHDAELIVPNQVHEDTVLEVNQASEAPSIREQALEGADALCVYDHDVAALLCFADCVPVILTAPTGAFSVVHAGWHGVDNLISAKAATMLARHVADELGVTPEVAIAGLNVYIGPHIHRECFETSAELHDAFVEKFGEDCSYDPCHIELSMALRAQLERVGVSPERIADVNRCTVCENEPFFSFRAQDGIAGRQGAFACNPTRKGE